MRKMKVRSIIAVLLVVVMGMMTGCIHKFDAGAYTKACLDASFKAEFDEYIKMAKIPEEEAQKDYDELIDTHVKSFGFKDMGLSEELLAQYRQFFVDLLKSTKYTIKEVKEDESKNFTVDVEIEPMIVFEGVGEEAIVEAQNYVAELLADGKNMPSDEEISEICGQLIYDLLVEKLENVTYDKKQVITIAITKSEDNVYEISEEDFGKLYEKMFDVNNFKFE